MEKWVWRRIYSSRSEEKVFENNRASLVGKAEGRLGCWILQKVNLSVNGKSLGEGGASDEKSPSGGWWGAESDRRSGAWTKRKRKSEEWRLEREQEKKKKREEKWSGGQTDMFYFFHLSPGLILARFGLGSSLSQSLALLCRSSDFGSIVCWSFQIFDSAPLSRHHSNSSSSSTSRGYTRTFHSQHTHTQHIHKLTHLLHALTRHRAIELDKISLGLGHLLQPGRNRQTKKKRNINTLTPTHITQHFNTSTLTHHHQ